MYICTRRLKVVVVVVVPVLDTRSSSHSYGSRTTWICFTYSYTGRGPFLETSRARKAIFRLSVSKNGEVYTPETSCMKGTFLQYKNT